MKAWFILGGMAAVAAALVLWLGTDRAEDVHRLFESATKEKPVIEKALGECGDLVRYFADRKPTERKKGELDDLRRRFEALEKAANEADTDEHGDKVERKKRLADLETRYYQLRTDATDLAARLREMKHYDDELRPRMARLGKTKKALADAQTVSTDPEFQQRATVLLDESRKTQQLADDALRRLSVKILEGRTMGQTALNELDDLMKRMDELLDKHVGSPNRKQDAAAPTGH